MGECKKNILKRAMDVNVHELCEMNLPLLGTYEWINF